MGSGKLLYIYIYISSFVSEDSLQCSVWLSRKLMKTKEISFFFFFNYSFFSYLRELKNELANINFSWTIYRAQITSEIFFFFFNLFYFSVCVSINVVCLLCKPRFIENKIIFFIKQCQNFIKEKGFLWFWFLVENC